VQLVIATFKQKSRARSRNCAHQPRYGLVATNVVRGPLCHVNAGACWSWRRSTGVRRRARYTACSDPVVDAFVAASRTLLEFSKEVFVLIGDIMMHTRDSRAPQPSGSPDLRRRVGLAGERGQALLETALILPLILLVSVSIFEFGRAYQTVQVLTNAAREGARVAILPNATQSDVQSRVTAYLQAGQLANSNATVSVNQNVTMSIGATTAAASLVTVNYPFSFMVLNPVAKLVVNGSTLGGAPLTLTASAEMRNEAQ